MLKWVVIGLLSWVGASILICAAWVVFKEWEGRR